LDYVFSDPAPLWAFGHGLSYTSFDYKNIRVEQDNLTENQTIRIEADITNTGAMDGKEVVQLYVRDKYASVATPVKELKRFEKIFLKKGETKTVKFTLPVSELALYDRQMKKKVEPGEFELQTGSASDKIHSVKNITITE
jgi:beta-glucosidase